MKTSSCFLALLVTVVHVPSLSGKDVAVQPGVITSAPADLTKTPKGLSGSDWSSIREAYEHNRHAIVANPDGSHQARNPGQAWLAKFDGHGFTVTPDAGGWSWGLELVGCGDVTEVNEDGGKISYVRGDGLTEWFVNDTRGLEQGWTLTKRPERAGSSGAFRLDLAVRGGLQPKISEGGASVAFLNEAGGAALTYGGLKAWDADGKTVPTHFETCETGSSVLRVVVNDADAKYPITIDPIAQQAAYLKASNTDAGDTFGCSVAVSGDTVVVGASGEDSYPDGVNGNQSNNSISSSGAAYVFVRNGTIWTQQAILKGSNAGINASFGRSVAVSGDTVVVGSPGDYRGNTPAVGGVYVFIRSGGIWTEQSYLSLSSNDTNDNFGRSVALSGDTVVVGAAYEDSNATGVNGSQANNSATDSGAAYVFVRNGTAWTQQAYLKASNTGANDYFGVSVAVSGDTVVVGASGEDSNATGVNGNQTDNSGVGSGAAYVFVRSGTAWTQQAYLKASNTGGDFGISLAVSGDTVVVGARSEGSNATGVNGNQTDNSAFGAGAAYVFVRSGVSWSQQAYLKASNTEAGDLFGYSVAVSGDTVVVGAYQEASASGLNGNQADNSASSSGAAYVFVRSDSSWSQHAYLKASNTGANDAFGLSVAVSGDTLVVGASGEDSSATGVNGNQADNSATDSGAAYLFNLRSMFSIATTAVHGSVDGGGDHNSGTTALLTATASPGYAFIGWSGDATGTANPLSVLMDADKTITANFGPDPADTDNDGLSNYEEAVTYGTDPTKSDTDGDGLSDGWEVGLGRFSTIAGSFTWAQARADAHARSGELASFSTEARWNTALASLGAGAFDNFTGLWVGATDETTEGTWTWVNGNAFTFAQWATSRPVVTPGNNSDYIEVSGGYGGEIGKWYDRSSTLTRDGYILETGYATDPKISDMDGDGLNDGAEQAAGSNPFVSDTDGDGLSDEQEVNLTHTSPILVDSNGNGTSDAQEDPDGDGLNNLGEISHGTNPLVADSDADGINDGAEANYAGSFYKLVQGSFTYAQAVADAASRHGRVASFPTVADYTRMSSKARLTTQGYLWIGLSDAATEGTWLWTDGSTANYNRWLTGQPSGGAAENHVVIMENTTQWADTTEAFVAAGYIFERVGLDPLAPDTDGDGLTDSQEVNTILSSPVLDDTDGDGLLDGAEVNTHGSSPLLADTDADGINDRAEVEIYHTNPTLRDSDGDGFDDLFEVNTGFNPTSAASTPDAVSSIRTAVEFRFNAANGVSYRIEDSNDLTNWNMVEPAIIGQGGVVTRYYSTENMPKRYFRVRRN